MKPHWLCHLLAGCAHWADHWSVIVSMQCYRLNDILHAMWHCCLEQKRVISSHCQRGAGLVRGELSHFTAQQGENVKVLTVGKEIQIWWRAVSDSAWKVIADELVDGGVCICGCNVLCTSISYRQTQSSAVLVLSVGGFVCCALLLIFFIRPFYRQSNSVCGWSTVPKRGWCLMSLCSCSDLYLAWTHSTL